MSKFLMPIPLREDEPPGVEYAPRGVLLSKAITYTPGPTPAPYKSPLVVDGSWRGAQCLLHNDCTTADALARAVETPPGEGYLRAAHLPYPATWTKGWKPHQGEVVDKGAGI